MKKTIRISCILSALLLSALASCGETVSEGGAENTQPVGSGTAETEAIIPDTPESRLAVSDGVEAKDYAGATFRILGKEAFRDYYLAEEETGDVLVDAVWQRNRSVEDKFNIHIDARTMDTYDLIPALKNSVLAADDAYQLFAGQAVLSGGSVCDGLYCNWYDVQHVDFSKPWWSSSVIDDLTYDGKTFLAAGDFALTTVTQVYCMYFNKRIAAEYDIPDMYDEVKAGKWTADRLISLSRDLYRDLDGDNAKGDGDFYGFAIAASSSPVNAFLWSFGEKLCRKQTDGTITLDYYNEKVTAIYGKLHELTTSTDGVFVSYRTDDLEIPKEMFRSGQLLFLPQIFDFAATKLRDFTDDYGVIPYPKWDEAQKEYYTMADGAHELLAIPASVSDPDFVGAVTETLNAESWKRVLPVYYDLVLKAKGTRDEVSVAMIDDILEHRVFDFGYVYGMWGAAFWPQYLTAAKSADIASYYEANHKAYEDTVQAAFDFFEAYGK